MTTKVLIVNFGPGPVLVRTVQYPSNVVIEDFLVGVQSQKDFYVHTGQQLLVGEKYPAPVDAPTVDEIKGALKSGGPDAVSRLMSGYDPAPEPTSDNPCEKQ